jgi:hypothetical protein
MQLTAPMLNEVPTVEARSLRATKWLLFFAVLFLFNPQFLNLLSLSVPPLRPWKQVLCLLLYALFLLRFRYLAARIGLSHVAAVRRCIVVSIILVLVLAARTVAEGFNLTRISFAAFFYLAYVPFIMLPLVYLNQGGPRSFFVLFARLGALVGAGLILDHFFGFFETFSIGEASDYVASLRKGAEIRRAAFLMEGPNILGYCVNLCLLCQLYLVFVRSTRPPAKLFYAASAAVLFAGAFLSASRQVVATAAFALSVGMLLGILTRQSGRSRLGPVIVVLVLLPITAYIVREIVTESEQAMSVAERLAGGLDEQRLRLWGEGVALFGPSNIAGWFIGEGLGDTMRQKMAADESFHHHYESSIFASFHEGGWPLLFALLWPAVAAGLILLKQPKSLLKRLLLVYVVCSVVLNFVAPTGLHSTALIAIYSVLGLAMSLPAFLEVERPPAQGTVEG